MFHVVLETSWLETAKVVNIISDCFHMRTARNGVYCISCHQLLELLMQAGSLTTHVTNQHLASCIHVCPCVNDVLPSVLPQVGIKLWPVLTKDQVLLLECS